MFEDQNGDKSPKELIESLYKAFESFRRKMEDPSYIQIEGAIKQLMENQMSMKQDISDLKQKLLNPYDGLVVETRKNTEHRLNAEREDGDFEKIVDEHRELMQWKANITKVFWAILTGLGGLLTFFITQLADIFKK
jgi:hypothetical protein